MAHYKGAAKEAGRAMNLMKKRQKEQEELEIKKRKIEEEMSMKIGSITNKFDAHYDAIEQQLKLDTIGLVTLDEMKAKQEVAIKEREKKLAQKDQEAKLFIQNQEYEKQQREKKQKSALSFDVDEELEDVDDDNGSDEDNGSEKVEIEQKPNMTEPAILFKKKRFGKNPNVDTSFLPDVDREEEENKLRAKLQQEWAEKQKELKNQEIDIIYSYWDGSGHRKQLRMKKGNSMQQFLQRCLEQLRKEFHELKTVAVDQLMFVKEDLIIPQHYTFYDFIVTKARGKSGPLFSFDVREDVRIINDASVEKNESHAGKVVLRSWYERNKHIFPACRWEPYDPEKSYEKYTVSDKEKAKIIVK